MRTVRELLGRWRRKPGVALALGACLSLLSSCSRGHEGPLVITQSDGTPVPGAFGYGAPIALRSADPRAHADASWSARGVCVVHQSASVATIEPTGFGTCTVTTSASGLSGTVTFAIAAVTGIEVSGSDDQPFAVGETRTLSATATGPSPDAALVPVQWSPSEPPLGLGHKGFDVKLVAQNQLQITARAVSQATFLVSAGQAGQTVSVSSSPSSIQITAPSSHLRPGEDVTISARAFDTNGAPCEVINPAMSLDDAGCLANKTVPNVVGGIVTFAGVAGVADCPVVTVKSGAAVSNALAFDVAKVASVTVEGPAGPVLVGLSVTVRAVARDAAGVPFDRGLSATFTDPTGVFMLTRTSSFATSAASTKTGTAEITATVNGVASAPYRLRTVPGAVQLSGASDETIVGAKIPVNVTILDALRRPLAHERIGLVSLRADATKVSLDEGAVDGDHFVFYATPGAPTGPNGTAIVARWSDGKTTIDSLPWTLVVTDGAATP